MHRILVVDDNCYEDQLNSKHLTANNYDVNKVHCVENSLSAIKVINYDGIILDCL